MTSSDDRHVAAYAQYLCEDTWTLGQPTSIGQRRAPARIDVQCHIDAALERLFAAAVRAATIADERPTPDELIAYVDGTLAEVRRRSIELCAQRWPEIQQEIQLLRQLGSNPLSNAGLQPSKPPQ